MKFALFVSITLLSLGILVIAGGVFLYLTADKALTDFETVANSYLTSAISTLKSANNVIIAAEPALTSTSQMTGNATSTLMEIGTTTIDFGNALNINILGYLPFASAAEAILNVGSQIQGAVSQLQTMDISLSNVNIELENIKTSLHGIQTDLENTKAMLPTYFNQAHLAILLVTIGVPSFFGLLMCLGGGAILSLRREINKISDRVL